MKKGKSCTDDFHCKYWLIHGKIVVNRWFMRIVISNYKWEFPYWTEQLTCTAETGRVIIFFVNPQDLSRAFLVTFFALCFACKNIIYISVYILVYINDSLSFWGNFDQSILPKRKVWYHDVINCNYVNESKFYGIPTENKTRDLQGWTMTSKEMTTQSDHLQCIYVEWFYLFKSHT